MQKTAEALSAQDPELNEVYKKQKGAILMKFIKNYQVVFGATIIFFFVFIAIFAPLLAPHDPLATNVQVRLEGPSAIHPFGTDDLGRDMLSRIMFGARISLSVGIISTAIGGMIGIIIGIIAGYYGGKLDIIFGRLIDVQLAFPGMLLALIIVAILGPSTFNVIISISIFAIPSFARISRGSTLNVKKLEYVDAIKAIGASDIRVMFRHIFPNILSPLVVHATLYVGSAIMISAALSFLGVGTQPPTPEWGTMLSSGREFLGRAPHIAMFPGVMITLVVIAINMLGDGLRNALEPKD